VLKSKPDASTGIEVEKSVLRQAENTSSNKTVESCKYLFISK
jgi:hypothetical protein